MRERTPGQANHPDAVPRRRHLNPLQQGTPTPLDASAAHGGFGRRSNALRIRPLTLGDEPSLWTALYHALYVTPGAEPFPERLVQEPRIAQYDAGWMTQPGDAGLIAEIATQPVGTAWLRYWRREEQGYGFVDVTTPELSIAVFPGHRGCGIGIAVGESTEGAVTMLRTPRLR